MLLQRDPLVFTASTAVFRRCHSHAVVEQKALNQIQLHSSKTGSGPERTDWLTAIQTEFTAVAAHVLYRGCLRSACTRHGMN